MQPLEFEPPEALRNAIKCVWYLRKEFGDSPSDFEVVPDGYAELIFHFGNLYSLSSGGDQQPLPSPFMIGLLNQPVRFYVETRLEIIGIRCFPWTIFDLLGLPPGNDGVRIIEHPIAQLQSSLAAWIQAGNVQEAVAEVIHYFLTAGTGVATDSMLRKAGDAMREAKGTLPVGRVATMAHATVRTLERKFKQAAGHTVKDVSGLMRFEQVRNHLLLDPDANLAGLAHELGYTDQAHLSKDFKRYSGTTPAAFARKARK